MSFDKLQKAILTEAADEAAIVQERYKKLAQREKERITAQARDVEESILEEAKLAAEREASRLRQEHILTSKATVLAAKQDALNELEETLVHKLHQDQDMTSTLIRQLLAQLPSKAGTIVPGELHRDAIAKALQKNSKYKLSAEIIPNDGGLIYKNELTEINLSIRAIVRQVFTRHRAELAAALFA